MNLGNVHLIGLYCIIILKYTVQKHKKPKTYYITCDDWPTHSPASYNI